MLSKRLKWCHLELEGRGLADVLTNHIPNVCGSGCRCVFGGSTPFAKELVALLYVGSGIGLIVTCLIKDHGWHHSGLVKDDWIWLFDAIGFGGILEPVLLTFGLQ